MFLHSARESCLTILEVLFLICIVMCGGLLRMHLHGLRCSGFLFVRDVALECFARGSSCARITVTFLCLQHVRRGVFARKVLQEVLYHGGGVLSSSTDHLHDHWAAHFDKTNMTVTSSRNTLSFPLRLAFLAWSDHSELYSQ